MEAAIHTAFRDGRVHDAGALLDPAPPRLLQAGREHNIVAFRNWFYVIPHALGPFDLSDADATQSQSVWRSRWFDAAERELERRDASQTAGTREPAGAELMANDG